MENTANAPDYEGIVQKSMVRIGTWAQLLTAEEKRGLARAIEETGKIKDVEELTKVYKIIEQVLAGRVSAIRKHNFDVKKRTLVGTRVNRDFAELCKKAARSSGRSLNGWVYAACWNQIIRQNKAGTEQVLESAEEPDTNPWYGWGR